MFDWSLYKGNLAWLPERTLFLARHGSRAYGTSLPTSDDDYRGVAIAPREYYLGGVHRFEQAVCNDPDLTVFCLRKFIGLAGQGNPNVLEIMFVHDEDRLQVSAAGERLLAARDLFLSRRVKHTFSGYARAQLKRIDSHYRWLTKPPASQPTRAEFKLPERTLIPQDQLAAAEAGIRQKLDGWSADFLDDLPRDVREAILQKMSSHLAELQVCADDTLWMGAARAIGYDENFIHLLDMEKRYAARKREWDNYQLWQKTRNPARAALEAKSGYDCYLDDTEFLTDTGWKRYDEIAEESSLATLNQISGAIEFQRFSDRVEKPYSGLIVFVHSRHTNCAVTMNHRMWVSPARRGPTNGFSLDYKRESAAWQIKPAEDLLAGNRSYFHVRVTGDPTDVEYPIEDDWLILMGCYVSEGCVGKRLTDGSASVLRVSQKEGGRQQQYMTVLKHKHPDKIRAFQGIHNHEDGSLRCVEMVWTVADRELARSIESWCGSGSESKHLPAWVTSLSARQVDILLDVMIAGDGTDRPFSRVYYTSSKRLADDVQTMCVIGGVVSQVWGPYANRDDLPMFQVYVGRRATAVAACFSAGGSQNVSVEHVDNARIVCFTVPNEVLVTRRNGNIAIQGNTKHGAHLVRLMRMCREILETGKVLVRRPDAEELLSIRAGAWPYDKLREWADTEDAALEEVAKTSPLPKTPDFEAIDRLCVELISEAIQ